MRKASRSFVTGAAILGAAGLLVKVLGAFFRIPLSNAIGPIGMSYYEVAYPYYAGLLVISSAGLPTAIAKMVSERVSIGDYIGAKRVFRTALLLLVFIGLFAGLIMYAGSDLLSRVSTFEKANLCFRALAPALLLVSIMCAYRGYLQGMQLMTGTAISQVAEQVFKLGFGLLLAVKLLPKGPEYAAMGALIGVSISELAGLIVIIFYYLRKKDDFEAQIERQQTYEEVPRGVLLQSLALLALPITVGACISPLAGIVDSAMIGRILRSLGYAQEAAQTAYSLLRTNVTTLVNMPGVLTVALATSLVPAISAYMAQRDYRGVKLTAQLGLKLACIIGMPCSVGLWVLARPILTLLYPTLSPANLEIAAELLKTASVGVFFLSLVQTMTGVIQGLGRPNVPVFHLFIGFLLKVVTLVVLMKIPRVNIQGAAVSTVVCYAFAGLANVIYALRATKLRVRLIDVLFKPLLSSAAMGLCTFFLYRALSGHGSLATLAAVGGGVLVYAFLAIFLKMFSEAELAFIPGGGKLARLMYRQDR